MKIGPVCHHASAPVQMVKRAEPDGDLSALADLNPE